MKKKKKFNEAFKDRVVENGRKTATLFQLLKLTKELNKELKDEDKEQKRYDTFIRRWVFEKLSNEEINQILKKSNLIDAGHRQRKRLMEAFSELVSYLLNSLTSLILILIRELHMWF